MRLRFLYRNLKARYRDQRAEISAIVRALAPDDWAVDVGANKGSYLWSMSHAVPQGRVVAFEPQPGLADYLRRVCPATGLSNVDIEAAGVSAQDGTLTLAIPGTGESSPGASFEQAVRDSEDCRTTEVPVHALDTYFAQQKQHIGAIKIDVEGHELAVLKGATKLLAAHAPLVVCESESRHMTEGTVLDVLAHFQSLSYSGYFVHRSRLVPVSEFRPEIHQRESGERFWDSPDYCNNFIMHKRG